MDVLVCLEGGTCTSNDRLPKPLSWHMAQLLQCSAGTPSHRLTTHTARTLSEQAATTARHGEVLSTSQHAGVGTCCPSARSCATTHTCSAAGGITTHTQNGWLEPRDPPVGARVCRRYTHTHPSSTQRLATPAASRTMLRAYGCQRHSKALHVTQEACVQGVRHCLVRRGLYVECRVGPPPPPPPPSSARGRVLQGYCCWSRSCRHPQQHAVVGPSTRKRQLRHTWALANTGSLCRARHSAQHTRCRKAQQATGVGMSPDADPGPHTDDTCECRRLRCCSTIQALLQS